jgi:hypothetical protein
MAKVKQLSIEKLIKKLGDRELIKNEGNQSRIEPLGRARRFITKENFPRWEKIISSYQRHGFLTSGPTVLLKSSLEADMKLARLVCR